MNPVNRKQPWQEVIGTRLQAKKTEIGNRKMGALDVGDCPRIIPRCAG
jgi:hypothetical protein